MSAAVEPGKYGGAGFVISGFNFNDRLYRGNE